MLSLKQKQCNIHFEIDLGRNVTAFVSHPPFECVWVPCVWYHSLTTQVSELPMSSLLSYLDYRSTPLCQAKVYILIVLSFNVVKNLTLENGHLTGQKNNLPGNIKQNGQKTIHPLPSGSWKCSLFKGHRPFCCWQGDHLKRQPVS